MFNKSRRSSNLSLFNPALQSDGCLSKFKCLICGGIPGQFFF